MTWSRRSRTAGPGRRRRCPATRVESGGMPRCNRRSPRQRRPPVRASASYRQASRVPPKRDQAVSSGVMLTRGWGMGWIRAGVVVTVVRLAKVRPCGTFAGMKREKWSGLLGRRPLVLDEDCFQVLDVFVPGKPPRPYVAAFKVSVLVPVQGIGGSFVVDLAPFA